VVAAADQQVALLAVHQADRLVADQRFKDK
jgi:hypothetical protein